MGNPSHHIVYQWICHIIVPNNYFKSKNNIKFREIFIPIIDTYSIGSLMAASIIETVAACVYFEVNPFNQPAVEQGKILTKQYLR